MEQEASMRIITEKKLRSFGVRHPEIATSIDFFVNTIRGAAWSDIEDARSIFPHADLVKVKSGHSITVFNIGGNKCRVIAALHYNTGMIYILDVLTHAEYDRGKWKERF